MSTIQTFQVLPAIPAPLAFLETLARNIWWCWNRDASDLFRRINPSLWSESGRNPIRFSTLVKQERFEELAKDKSFLAQMERVREAFEKQVLSPKPTPSEFDADALVAYFSMEFGLHESIPLYSGGLGVLAGDHLKAASDMRLPLVGIGLLYRQGYFRQFLDQDGWQQETYPEADLFSLPVERIRDPQGRPLVISVRGPHGDIHSIVWSITVGAIKLFLLDTNIPENPVELRDITARLYDGGTNKRLTQELVLGIGGMRALRSMGMKPTVVHMNEGHSAFAGLERLVQVMTDEGIDLTTALEVIPRTTVFTTHTPVAAGHDDFPADMVGPCLQPFESVLNTSLKEILSWGQPPGSGPEASLSMFILGRRMARYCNGVSELHGAVARRMWAHLWPRIPEDEVPISHVTNGVHVPSWTSKEVALLLERYSGPDWALSVRDPDSIKHVHDIYDEELWHAHELNRARLIRHCRKRMVEQHQRRNAPMGVMKEVENVLDQDILTIAFARRFATYKRATLLLKDPERLEAMITNEERPVQLIFAGKAHPQDNEGKGLIQRLIEFSQRPGMRHRIIFLEDYDIHTARRLVQGADVWLNTPRRPFEACGTSGMKAAINGVLNVSILDGWWCEGYDESRGWRIGNGEEFEDSEYQDRVEAQALYNVLENDVIPCFYDRENGGIPTRWLAKMKASIQMAMENFSARRMVADYNTRFYIPASMRYRKLLESNAAEALRLSRLHARLAALWKDVLIDPPARTSDAPLRVGESLDISVVVFLGELSPEEVEVELCYGRPISVDKLDATFREKLAVKEKRSDGAYLYTCAISCKNPGRYGFTARVTPKGDTWTRFMPGWVTWA
ncbi:MAG: alpha-glucan family phosphorylase [Desulfobacterales bacterium]